jgi:hypothetical protein
MVVSDCFVQNSQTCIEYVDLIAIRAVAGLQSRNSIPEFQDRTMELAMTINELNVALEYCGILQDRESEKAVWCREFIASAISNGIPRGLIVQ